MVSRHISETPPGEAGVIPSRSDGSAVGTRSVLQVIADLFPAPTQGQTFTKRFIERATLERSIVPDVRAGEHVICVKSIAVLGRELNLSNDTTNKYVLLFKALGLLEKRKIPGVLAFVFTLGIYQPPATLEANLDYLITRCSLKKSRGKFHRLLSDVKERCQVHGWIAQDLRSGLEILHTLLQVDSPSVRSPRKLERRLMQAQRLVSTLMAQLVEGPLPLPTSWVDSVSQIASSRHPHIDTSRGAEEERQRLEAPPMLEKDRPCNTLHALNLPPSTSAGDGGQQQPQTESTQRMQSGGRSTTSVVQHLSELEKMVDSRKAPELVASTQSGPSGRFRSPSQPSQQPETVKKVDSEEVSNVNVITFIQTITLNVEMVALFCCKTLGEDPTKKRGIYSKLFRDVAYDTQAITAALVYVLVHRRDGTIRNPAAVFHTRCKDYHERGVPEDVAVLVDQYGSLPYAQLVNVLQQPIPAKTTPPPSWTQREGAPGQPRAAVQQLPPIPTLTTRLSARIALREGHGLTFEDARQLFSTISSDLRIRLFGKGVAQLSDGSYAVLVDNTVSSRIRQAAFYSPQEWQACSATMRCGADLFESGERTSRPRPTFLQKGAR